MAGMHSGQKGTGSRRKPQSIKVQITVMILVLALGILAALLYSFFDFYSLQYNTVKQNQVIMAEQMANSASKSCQNIGKISQSVAYSQIVQDYLNHRDAANKFAQYQSVANLLNNTKAVGDGIVDIAVIGLDGNFINIEGDINTARQLMGELPEAGETYFFGEEDYHLNTRSKACIVTGMWVNSLNPGKSSSSKLGAVFVAVDPSALLDVPYSAEGASDLEILFWDRNQKLISGRQDLFENFSQQADGQKKSSLWINREEYLTLTGSIPEMAGGFAMLVPYKAFQTGIAGIVIQQYALIALVFVVIGVMLTFNLRRVFRSINGLTGIMHRINTGNRTALKERIDENGPCVEVNSIASSFNSMMDEVTKLNHDVFISYTRMYEMQMAAKQSELVYLRSQINPHFLYNTLELICGLSAEGNNDGVEKITRALGSTLRYSIKGGDVVSLQKELEITKSYVMIQTTRFEGRFAVSYNIEEQALAAQVPKMILQPLVENAVFHGLEQKLDFGHLAVGAKVSGGIAVLWVQDDGLGMNAARLREVREYLKAGANTKQENPLVKPEEVSGDAKESLGIANVNSRIRLYFGEQYGVHIESEENKGTKVVIRMPFKT